MADVTCCEKCCKPLDDHPLIDVSNVKVLQMCDRHPKWQRVEPGTVIPAGQPYRVEFADKNLVAAREHRGDVRPFIADPHNVRPGGDPNAVYFIDSSWKPPLVLPTEPTWGIAVFGRAAKHPFRVSKWHQASGWFHKLNGGAYSRAAVTDFIPLTDEQVARIEAAR